MRYFTHCSTPRLTRIALAASMLVALPALSRAQALPGVTAQGAGAVVTTLLANQQFAATTLPSPDGFATNSVAAASVPTLLTASALNAITSGMVDVDRVSSQTSAEAADVSILGGLVTARQITAVAASYAGSAGAASNGAGSAVTGLVVAGTTIADGAVAPNTRISLPGVGYVVLNEQTVTGDGVTATGITVNMIHVVLTNALTGAKTGEVIIGCASSNAAL